jgi:hypothetical protein
MPIQGDRGIQRIIDGPEERAYAPGVVIVAVVSPAAPDWRRWA